MMVIYEFVILHFVIELQYVVSKLKQGR